MVLSSTKIGIDGVPYRDGANVSVTVGLSCSFEDIVEGLREAGADVRVGVVLDDGTVLLAGND